MTRDQYRYECIQAMVNAGNKFRRGHGPTWDLMTAAFDALHDIARVVPVEAMEEMIKAEYSREGQIRAWDFMSAKGDLTNPPEKP